MKDLQSATPVQSGESHLPAISINLTPGRAVAISSHIDEILVIPKKHAKAKKSAGKPSEVSRHLSSEQMIAMLEKKEKEKREEEERKAQRKVEREEKKKKKQEEKEKQQQQKAKKRMAQQQMKNAKKKGKSKRNQYSTLTVSMQDDGVCK